MHKNSFNCVKSIVKIKKQQNNKQKPENIFAISQQE